MAYPLRVTWNALDWTEADRLRKAIVAAGFRDGVKPLAEEAGVARHTIGRWLRGDHVAQSSTRLAVLRVLAERLPLTVGQLEAWIATGSRLDP